MSSEWAVGQHRRGEIRGTDLNCEFVVLESLGGISAGRWRIQVCDTGHTYQFIESWPNALVEEPIPPGATWQDWIEPGGTLKEGYWSPCRNGGPGKCPGRERFRLVAADGTVLREVPPAPVPVVTDWSPWLPPHPLPDQGPLPWKAGQVWAWSADNADPIVYRVRHDADEKRGGVDVLARPYSPNCKETHMMGGTWGQAVLVQDVGQAQPTPPEELYGEPAKSFSFDSFLKSVRQ